MTTHHVYVHDRLGGEAIKDGFSWPGFLLTWIWAFHKHLFKTGAGLLTLQLALLGAAYAGRAADQPLWVVGALLLDVACRALVGLRGNYLRENSMDRRGFVFEASVTAETADKALERVLRGGGRGAARDERTVIAGLAPARVLGAALAAALILAIVATLWSERDAPTATTGESARKAAPPAAEPAPPEATAPPPAEPPLVPALSRPPLPSRTVTPPPQRTPSATGDDRSPAGSAARPSATANGTDASTLGNSPAASPPPPAAGDRDDRSLAAKERAWSRHYKPPPHCVDPADWDTYVECTNHMIRARQAFEDQWAAGQPY